MVAFRKGQKTKVRVLDLCSETTGDVWLWERVGDILRIEPKVPFIIIGLALTFLVSINPISAATLESENLPQLPKISGTVASVTPEGIILLRPDNATNDEIVGIHQWGYEVDPTILSILTLGRTLDCSIIYDAETYLGVTCMLLFFPNSEDEPRNTGLSHAHRGTRTSLRSVLTKLGKGRYRCSADDRHYFSVMPDNPPYRPHRYQERCAYFEKNLPPAE